MSLATAGTFVAGAVFDRAEEYIADHLQSGIRSVENKLIAKGKKLFKTKISSLKASKRPMKSGARVVTKSPLYRSLSLHSRHDSTSTMKRKYASPRGSLRSVRRRLYSQGRTKTAMARARTMIGRRIGGSSTAKTHLSPILPGFLDSRTFVKDINLLAIEQSSSAALTHARQSFVIDVIGFAVEFHVKASSASDTYSSLNGIPYLNPMLWNVAIIAPTDNNVVTTDDFFRSQGENKSTRDIDFTNALSAIEMHGLPINTDKFQILMHKRFKVGSCNKQSTTNGSTGAVPDIATFKKWVPMYRQVAYSDSTADKCTSPVYFVYWYDHMFAPAPLGAQPRGAVIEAKVVTYFRDPHN